jgi:hypothetical protein
MNPLTRILAGLFGLVALVGAFFFGFLILAVAVAVGMAAWIAIRLRVWWLGRRAGSNGAQRAPAPGDPGRSDEGSSVIEGEYKVVSRRED